MDWNNDGRKDLITGEYDGHIRIYLNGGTAANPTFTGYEYLQVAGTNWIAGYSKPEVVDWNNDGLFDILCGDGDGFVHLLLNAGSPGNPVFNSDCCLSNGVNPILISGGRASPVAVDWNRDGKKDLIIGGYDGTLRYYENVGSDENPVFASYSTLNAGGKPISVGYYSRPEVADWDNDGWQDLLVGSYEAVEGSYAGHVFYFHALSGPYLKSSTLTDANGNGFLEPGELCTLNAVLVNNAASVTGVVATLSTSSPWCTVTLSNWVVGDFPVPYSCANGAQPLRFNIATNAPFGAKLAFTLTISGNAGAYRQVHQLAYQVAQPQFGVAGLLVNDSAGNGDCLCDPGERVQLLVKLRNSSYRAEAVSGQLIPVTPGVILLNATAAFGTLERNAQSICSQNPFAFVLPTTMPSNSIYLFTLRLSYLNGSQVTNLPIQLGDYVVSSNTPFAWMDLAAGTTVPLTDESYRSVPLGFNFPFYGLVTNQVHLLSNGYLMFGNPYPSYNIRSIPSTNNPNRLIAPWWEDLDPGKGGSVRYQVLGTAPNRCFVAEWNNVPRYYYTNYVRSFQAILNENGSIKFQYGPSAGTLGVRTIGLENADGTVGKAWTYPVTNGVALLFSVQGAADADRDGLPDAFEQFYFGSLGSTATADPDRDGQNNWMEFCAGTNPNDGASHLRLECVSLNASGQLLLRWRSIPGRYYSVWGLQDPATSTWSNLTATPLPGAPNGTNSYLVPWSVETSVGLFRLRMP